MIILYNLYNYFDKYYGRFLHIVYNNTSLYLAEVSITDESNLKGDSETKKLRFFYPDEVPNNLMDADLIKSYINYSTKRYR